VETQIVRSRHEKGKSLRRRRIIEAAAALASEADSDTVSMAQVAARAGVSPATLYNLFQTKSAIFRAVFEDDHNQFREAVAAAGIESPFERIFVALEVVMARYERNPQFYRGTVRLTGAQSLYAEMSDHVGYRSVFWRDLLVEAVAAGEIRAEVNPEVFGLLMVQVTRSQFLDWAWGVIDLSRAEDQAAYMFALMLQKYVTPSTDAKLASRIAKLERVLARNNKVGS